jgi:hypothetical protein
MSTVRSLFTILLTEKNRCTPSSKIRYHQVGTDDPNTDKGKVGGSSPPRPAIQCRDYARFSPRELVHVLVHASLKNSL